MVRTQEYIQERISNSTMRARTIKTFKEHVSFLIQEAKTNSFPPDEFKRKCEKALEDAVKKWKEWLDYPVTAAKFVQNYKEAGKPEIAARQKEIFNKYRQQLDQMKIVYYEADDKKIKPGRWVKALRMDKLRKSGMDKADAFVTPIRKYMDYIFVNYTESSTNKAREIYSTMIHELQHTLYGIQPLNPEIKIRSAFVTDAKERSDAERPDEYLHSIFVSRTMPDKKLTTDQNAIRNIKKIFPSISEDEAMSIYWYWEARLKESENKSGYISDDNESMSRIMSMRTDDFGLSPGQNITKEMLLPYVRAFHFSSDISWLLLRWAANGYKDLDAFLNQINSLAKGKGKNSDMA